MTKILFLDGTRGFTPNGLNERPTGGICTSLSLIPQYLTKMGCECYVKSVHDKDETVNGVHYLGYNTPAPNDLDLAVFNRNSFNHQAITTMMVRNVKVIWWLHDIVDHRYLADSAYQRIAHIVSLGDYCTESYSEFYNISKDKFHIISNGIDPKVWYPGKYEKRDPNLYIYASAPVKGYSSCSFAFNNLKRCNPKVRLVIYGSQSLHGLENTESYIRWLESMKQMGAEVGKPIPHKELADVFRKAWCLMMPNDYPEMCSNLILQARACGLPIVSSRVGGGKEWIEHEKTGLLTKYFPHDKFLFWFDFTRNIMRLATDKGLHKMLSLNAPVGIPTWKEVSKQWYEFAQTCVGKSKLVGVR